MNSNLIQPADAESIAHCLDRPGSRLLTDDAAARTIAESLGIEVRGSIGVVLVNAALDLIKLEEAKEYLFALEKSTLWVSPKVMAEARKFLTGEDLE